MAIRLLTAGLASLMITAMPQASAFAAPQILALLETDGPSPLVCEGGKCSAEFSGFCLQKERTDPKYGAQYRAEGGDLTLVVTDASGAVRRLPAGDYLDISTLRSYTAVRISLPESVIRELGAVSVALEIGERVALVPVESTGDKDPQSEADIALALGPQRALGQKIMQQSAGESGAVALTNRMLNALPRGRADDETRAGLWDRAIAPYSASYPAESVSRASGIYRRCLTKVEEGSFFNLRDCLEIGHDTLMLDLNVKYWEAGPES
ncbi:MAG: hypothetical protein IMF05_16935 [Proteobacteria bacterium]|nr:hypothetical protein [Pseudomonadota bacterium]